MNLFRRLTLIFLLTGLGFAAAFPVSAAQSEQEFLSTLPAEIAAKTLEHRLQEGEMIPDFSLQTVDGVKVSEATINGKPTILAFIAIDNETRKERALELLTLLRILREQYGEQVNIYAICSDRAGCESPEVKKAGGPGLPIVDDTQRVAYGLFGIFMMPTTMIISPDGRLLKKLAFSGAARNPLGGWLQVALGEISAEQLQSKLATRTPERSAEEKRALHHLQLARVMVQRRIYPQAVAEFTKAAALQPNNPELLLEKGFVQLKIEQWGGAAEEFRKVLEINPDSIAAIAGLGLALHGQGQDDAAVLELEDAANVTKPMPRVLIALAEIYSARGDKDLALGSYAKAFRQLARELERCESFTGAED